MLGEFSLVAVERARVEHLAEEGDRRAARVLEALRTLSFQLSGSQLGITAISILLGFTAAPVIARAVDPVLEGIPGVHVEAGSGLSIVVALGIATVVQMVVGELVPKSWAIARPLPTAMAVVVPFRWFVLAFRPFIRALGGAANAVVRLLGVEPRQELISVRSLDELDLLIRASAAEGKIQQSALPVLVRSVAFAGKAAADALVPRTAVVGIPHDASVAELVRSSLATGFSRFPVHAGDLDDVRGVVHVKDAVRVPREAWASTPVAELMLDAPVVPEWRDLAALVSDLTSSGRQMAIVVDEYGGTAGIITMEDVLEELVGEIQDEHDPAPGGGQEVPGPPGAFVLSGMAHPEEVEERTGFVVPQGAYDTLAGFLLSRLGRLPEPGDRVDEGGWVLVVEGMDGHRIDRVRVMAPPGRAREGGPP